MQMHLNTCAFIKLRVGEGRPPHTDKPQALSSVQQRAAAEFLDIEAAGAGVSVSVSPLRGYQDSAAIRTSVAMVFILRAVPDLAAATTSFDAAMPWQ